MYDKQEEEESRMYRHHNSGIMYDKKEEEESRMYRHHTIVV